MARILLENPLAGCEAGKKRRGDEGTEGTGGMVRRCLASWCGGCLAGCGGGSKSSSSTTGATATQRVKRLEVTVVRPRAEAPAAARPFLARAAELLGWPRDAEAATCSVSAGGVGPVQTDASGKATLLNVPVDSSGIIPVSINCDGTGRAR